MKNDTSCEYRAALMDCPPAQAALNNWVSRTAILAATAGVLPENAWREIADAAACATIDPCEVWNAVEHAYASNAGGAR